MIGPLLACGRTEPVAEPSEPSSLLDRATAALEAANGDGSAVLRDPEFMSLHPLPAFRELIERAAKPQPLVIVTPHEPGTPMLMRGTVLDASREPIADVLVYVYQTDARGWYAADSPHVAGMAGDARHARLFGYLRTDAQGRFEVRTIVPLGYPQTDLPAHIHVELQKDEQELAVTEMLFPDDPRLTPERREHGEQAGFVVATPSRTEDGTAVYSAEFVT